MKSTLFFFILIGSLMALSQESCTEEVRSLYKSKELDKAYELFNTCPGAENDTSLQLLGMNIHLSRFEEQEALGLAFKVYQKDTLNQTAINGIGAAYLLLEMGDSAIYYFLKNIQIDSTYKHGYYNVALYYLGIEKYDSALINIQHYIKIYPSDFDASILLGDIYYENENNDSALFYYRRAEKLSVNNAYELDMLAQSFLMLNEYQTALAFVERAILLEPSNAQLYYTKGRVYYYMDDEHNKQAIKNFKKSLALEEASNANYYLGLCFAQDKKYAEARIYYDKAIAIDSNDIDFYIDKSDSYFYEGNYSMALEIINIAISIDTLDLFALGNRVFIYLELGEFQAAHHDVDRILNLDSTHAEAYFYRALIYEDQKKYSAAIREYTKAIVLDPQYVNALYNRAILYSEMDEPDLAIKDYDRVIQIDPTDTDALVNRGIIYYEQNKKHLYCDDFAEAARLGDDYAKKLLKELCR